LTASRRNPFLHILTPYAKLGSFNETNKIAMQLS